VKSIELCAQAPGMAPVSLWHPILSLLETPNALGGPARDARRPTRR
jgi:hypothetical protein